MSLRVLDSPEPFTEASQTRGTYDNPLDHRRTRFAESEVYRRLCHEVYRYAKGEISGRSFLIAGHRGSGKTTSVLKAIEDTDQVLFRERAPRPLLVRLYGPDLLPASPGSGTRNFQLQSFGKGGYDKTDSDDPQGVATRVLKEVTRAIYQAAANEIARAYRDRALMDNFFDIVGIPWPSKRKARETAARFRVELDEAPDFGVLRGFWRSSWLRSGVLGPFRSGGARSGHDQGLQEVIALSSAAEAYLRVIGTTTEKEVGTISATDKTDKGLSATFDLKNVRKLATPLAAAIVAALGTTALTAKFASAYSGTLLSNVVTVLAGLFAFTGTYSVSRSRASSTSREFTFLPDTSLSSLSRTLPALVDRLRLAGLAPVFVVDELDKVADLPTRMGELISHLKQFVTERAFSCFLTNRDYLEWLRSLSLEKAYPPEHSFFSDRLLILLTPEDLHRYLAETIATSGDPKEQLAEQLERDVLPYVLLHRSQMHPIDLRRQIAQIRNGAGEITLTPDDIRPDRFGFDVLIQVVIEHLLGQPELADKLQRDPDFRQLAYDTLYYPSRKWEGNTLDVSKTEFRKYLRTRIEASGLQSAAPRSEGGLTDSDIDFLHLRLRQLVGFLAVPPTLMARLGPNMKPEGPLTSHVLSFLASVPPEGLLDETGNPDIYEWRYDASGRPLKPLQVDAILTDDLARRKSLVDFVEKNVADFTAGAVNLSASRSRCGFCPPRPHGPPSAPRCSASTSSSRIEPKARPSLIPKCSPTVTLSGLMPKCFAATAVP